MSTFFLPKRALPILALVGLAAAGCWFAWSNYRVAQLRDYVSGYAKRGDWKKAEAAIDQIEWYGGLDAESTKVRTLAALSRRDAMSAARFLGMVPENAPDAAASYERQGFLLRDAYRAAEAEAAFRRALRVDPKRLEARRALVALLGLERRGTEQETELWKLLARTDRPLDPLRVLAQGASAIPPDGLPPGMDEGQVLERVVRAEPDNDFARTALAHYFRGRGDVERARNILDQAPKATPIVLLEQLAGRIDEGDLDGIDHELDRIDAGIDPERNLRLLRVRAGFELAKGEAERAVASLTEAIKHDPRGVETRYRMGQALLASKRTPESTSYLDYAKDTLSLKTLVAGLPDENPDPALCAEAEVLCRRMGRTREADAWRSLVTGKRSK